MGEVVITEAFNTWFMTFTLRTCLLLAITISGAVALLAVLMAINMETICK